MVSWPWTSTPRSSSPTPKKKMLRRPGSTRSASTHCTALDHPDVFLLGEALAGSCGRGTPAPGPPPPTTSPCSTWPWRWAGFASSPRARREGLGFFARADSAGATHAFAAGLPAEGHGLQLRLPGGRGRPVGNSASCPKTFSGAGGTKTTASRGKVPSSPSSPLCSTFRPGRPALGNRLPADIPARCRADAVRSQRRFALHHLCNRHQPGHDASEIARPRAGHHRHAHAEDHIRQSKAAGLNNFPCEGVAEQGLDGGCPGRRRPRVLVQAHMLLRRARHRPLRDRGFPLRHLAHGRTAHPLGPGAPLAPRPHRAWARVLALKILRLGAAFQLRPSSYPSTATACPAL